MTTEKSARIEALCAVVANKIAKRLADAGLSRGSYTVKILEEFDESGFSIRSPEIARAELRVYVAGKVWRGTCSFSTELLYGDDRKTEFVALTGLEWFVAEMRKAEVPVLMT